MLPLVTILIPTFNRSMLLRQALESALAQTYSNLEIIVCDNASTDDTGKTVGQYTADPRLRYVRNTQNIGLVRNWEKGVVKEAKGDWFLILSDDDYLTDTNFISAAIDNAEMDKDIRVVFAAGTVRYEQYQTEVPMQIPYQPIEDGKNIFINRDSIVKPVEFILCGLLFHRATALEQKPFSDPDNFCCDAGLYFKLCLSWKVAILHAPVCVYREHGGNTLKNHKTWAQQTAILRMYFELWALANACEHFNRDQLLTWRHRVLLRACRTFTIGVKLYVGKDYSTRASIDEIRKIGAIGSFELFANPVFLLKFLLANSPALYSKATSIRLWNTTRTK